MIIYIFFIIIIIVIVRILFRSHILFQYMLESLLQKGI